MHRACLWGGRLRARVQFWVQFSATAYVVSWVYVAFWIFVFKFFWIIGLLALCMAIMPSSLSLALLLLLVCFSNDTEPRTGSSRSPSLPRLALSSDQSMSHISVYLPIRWDICRIFFQSWQLLSFNVYNPTYFYI